MQMLPKPANVSKTGVRPKSRRMLYLAKRTDEGATKSWNNPIAMVICTDSEQYLEDTIKEKMMITHGNMPVFMRVGSPLTREFISVIRLGVAAKGIPLGVVLPDGIGI